MSDEFFSAVESGNWRQVALLIERGSIDVNAPFQIDRYRVPPLVFAAQSGEDDIVDLLLNAGAHINDCDGIGRTACFVAVEYGHSDILHRLTARGADVAICDHRGRSPLSIAAYGTNRMLTMALIDAGAPLSDPLLLCQTASLSAAIVAMLLQRRIDVSACRSIDSGTACHTAVMRSDDPDVLHALVHRGRVDVNATNQDLKNMRSLLCPI
jgi:ankyrin repeat protein